LGKLDQGIDYLHKWHNDIQPLYLYISTSVNKYKLDLVEAMMGASNVIFMNFHEEIAIFRQYTLDMTNHEYPSSFDVLQ
jgi:hypothetical protein